jgi:hypothetical protein
MEEKDYVIIGDDDVPLYKTQEQIEKDIIKFEKELSAKFEEMVRLNVNVESNTPLYGLKRSEYDSYQYYLKGS